MLTLQKKLIHGIQVRGEQFKYFTSYAFYLVGGTFYYIWLAQLFFFVMGLNIDALGCSNVEYIPVSGITFYLNDCRSMCLDGENWYEFPFVFMGDLI